MVFVHHFTIHKTIFIYFFPPIWSLYGPLREILALPHFPGKKWSFRAVFLGIG